MKIDDFKVISDYLGKETIAYILTKGLDYDPMTEKRRYLISLIECLPNSQYIKLNCNVTKRGTIQLHSLPKKKRANAIFIKHSVLVCILQEKQLSLDLLIARKDILLKTEESINKQLGNKRLRGVDARKGQRDWRDKTRSELLKKSTKYEKRVFKKLESAFGERVKVQKLFVINGKTYFADIAIKSKKLIIEVDGEYHNTSEQKKKDDARDKAFESIGYKTIRIPNDKVEDKQFMQYFIETVKEYKPLNNN